MKVLLASPRGFCAGVRRAVESLQTALGRFEPPIYVYNEIVHNRHVVEEFSDRVRFVRDVDVVPTGATLMISAHGVSPDVRHRALARNLRVLDATCPLVTRLHELARRFAADGYHILLIGHRGHDEVVGVQGEVPGAISV
ncbi:MAG: 4-hydroxy-3-methylbut-2-enyl diphosphate reductase, partial [Planctomycetia bacterium]|nr:4-hydroxy-3-methylbut-2-enyl diphosphate reductase [Planctomycetia bacterium]